jgi:hypothetical protein
MQSSSACLSLLVCLAAPLVATAQVEQDATAGEPVAEAAVTAEDEGPPAPDEPAEELEQVLVLPSLTPVDAGVDGATLDVLLASVLQDLGFEVRDARVVNEQLDADAPTLAKARDSYLDMNLEGALTHATAVRDAHLAHGGDLLADPQLTEAELFMAQVLIDMGRQNEAAALAARILLRRPDLRLDPADHSPTMLALWSATVLGQAGRDPKAPAEDELAAFGRDVGVDWIVVGVWRSGTESAASMLVLVVPTGGGEQPSRHEVVLGPRSRWAGSVRTALLERFPPPAPPTPPGPPPGLPPDPNGSNGQVDEDGKWYKTWWFWTIVGAVVVGGTAGAVGGYYANREEQSPQVTGDFWRQPN